MKRGLSIEEDETDDDADEEDADAAPLTFSFSAFLLYLSNTSKGSALPTLHNLTVPSFEDVRTISSLFDEDDDVFEDFHAHAAERIGLL